MKVLVVDDEQLVRWFLERALKRWGHEVTSVSNINEAVHIAEREEFDIVFTDLKMPEGDGSILVDKLCAMTNRPEIVVCSAYITPDLDRDLDRKSVV